ncbi:MAG: pilus assembly protein PilM [Proteobacteria bacterium]|nr:pilus assembly protein PilM [Pseudomonadota bacterium]MBU4067573.1 pilus assembly protein PilM [Pseudomonadota bacterium]MBU4101860.1 pilus assembly protein PilM [Pseudomonadota bacterium]MBU4126834.1 pilus assembly protein PilM [Pseudomonadota bacterium]
MIFRKSPGLVGLDIGSSALKAGEITATKKGFALKNFGMISIAQGAIEEGNINDPENVADSIRQLFKANNIKEKDVAISIGGYSVIVKKIDLQTVTEEQLQKTIHLEAEQYIPFDISEVNIDYQILGEREADSNQMSVMLVAAKKEMINEYINLVQIAGLNPCIIDVDAFALQNIFEVNYDLIDENVVLIDIGANKTSLNILKGYSSVFMRDVSLGCSQINQKIISLIDCSFIEAEQLKLSKQTDKISPDDLKQTVSSVVSEWSIEIRRALDFYYSANPDEQIKSIVLSGGGAHIKEFRQLLAAETSSKVETINPFKKLDVSARFDPSYLAQIAPQAAICMGLALRRVADK